MNWNLTGLRVEGNYCDEIPVAGKVTDSRVCYGGAIQHTVVIDEAFDYGHGIKREAGDVVLLDHKLVTRITEV